MNSACVYQNRRENYEREAFLRGGGYLCCTRVVAGTSSYHADVASPPGMVYVVVYSTALQNALARSMRRLGSISNARQFLGCIEYSVGEVGACNGKPQTMRREKEAIVWSEKRTQWLRTLSNAIKRHNSEFQARGPVREKCHISWPYEFDACR